MEFVTIEDFDHPIKGVSFTPRDVNSWDSAFANADWSCTPARALS